MTTLVQIGNRIREARTRRSLSQTSLAKIIGKSKQLVSAWERGRAELTSTSLARISQILSVDPSSLLFGTSGTTPDFPGAGTLLPDFCQSKCADFVLSRASSSEASRYIRLPYIFGSRAISLQLQTNALAPQLIAGDRVVVDPDVIAAPGDIVAFYVIAHAGRVLTSPIVVVGRLSYKGPLIGKAPFSVNPTAVGWPTYEIAQDSDGQIIGVVVGDIRQHERIL